jgi:hypothetical protein
MIVSALDQAGDPSLDATICSRHFQRAENGPLQEVMFRLANSDGQRSNAQFLLNQIYARKGFGSNHSFARSQKSSTFVASVEDHIFGTLTLTADSSDGLGLDSTFRDQIDYFRATARLDICELTKFAFDPSPRSRPLLAALFHIIYIYGVSHLNCSDLLIEVNPRHVRFYETMLGFSKVGAPRTNKHVCAPAQLMHITVDQISESIRMLAGKQTPGERSLYPYFFSPAEEAGIRTRLARENGLGRTNEVTSLGSTLAVPSPSSRQKVH